MYRKHFAKKSVFLLLLRTDLLICWVKKVSNLQYRIYLLTQNDKYVSTTYFVFVIWFICVNTLVECQYVLQIKMAMCHLLLFFIESNISIFLKQETASLHTKTMIETYWFCVSSYSIIFQFLKLKISRFKFTLYLISKKDWAIFLI